jgi:Uma2 family endonuclease
MLTTAVEKISFEQYLKAYDSVEGVRTEWLAGEVAAYPMSNNTQHQDILKFLTILLDVFLSLKGYGRLVLEGIPMYLGDHLPAREPDLMILLNDSIPRLKATYLDGRADIVIEIVSPESGERDRGVKFTEYEAAGVPEYWLFDPLRTEARIYALGDDGRYHPAGEDAEGRLVSPLLPGFALLPSLLWREPLPAGMEIVKLAQAMV